MLFKTTVNWLFTDRLYYLVISRILFADDRASVLRYFSSFLNH